MNFASGARDARGTYATLHNDVRWGTRYVKMLLHGVQNICIEVKKIIKKYIIFFY